MGLHVSILKPADMPDCTNRGISFFAKSLCLVNVSGPFEPDSNHPAALLAKRNGVLTIVPAMEVRGKWVQAPGWWMMGGNYAATSDSRFGQACKELMEHDFYGAVAIHDRQE